MRMVQSVVAGFDAPLATVTKRGSSVSLPVSIFLPSTTMQDRTVRLFGVGEKMNVRELIIQLSALDPNAEVFVWSELSPDPYTEPIVRSGLTRIVLVPNDPDLYRGFTPS